MLPRDGLTEGNACRTSMRLLRGAPAHSLNSALPSGLARWRNLAASFSSLADAARAGKQDLCAGAHRSAYLARAVRKLTGPACTHTLLTELPNGWLPCGPQTVLICTFDSLHFSVALLCAKSHAHIWDMSSCLYNFSSGSLLLS